MQTSSPGRSDGVLAEAGRRGWPASVRRLLLTLLTASMVPGVLSGCARFYSNPQVRLLDVEIGSLGLTSGNLAVRLEVTNPNRFGVELRSVRYRLELADPDDRAQWHLLASGESNEGARVGGREVEQIALNLPFRYGSLGSAFRIVLRGEDLRYRILGDLTARGPLGEVEFPFESRGLLEM